MPKYRNTQTGAVVSCKAETAVRLGRNWCPIDDPPATAPKRAKASRPRATKRTKK